MENVYSSNKTLILLISFLLINLIYLGKVIFKLHRYNKLQMSMLLPFILKHL